MGHVSTSFYFLWSITQPIDRETAATFKGIFLIKCKFDRRIHAYCSSGPNKSIAFPKKKNQLR